MNCCVKLVLADYTTQGTRDFSEDKLKQTVKLLCYKRIGCFHHLQQHLLLINKYLDFKDDKLI